jgi:hypothetical protein
LSREFKHPVVRWRRSQGQWERRLNRKATHAGTLFSPPLVAVIWRPLAALGEMSMTIWWAANLALVTLLVVFFAAVGRRWTRGGLLVILAL